MAIIVTRQACAKRTDGLSLSLAYWDLDSGTAGPVLLALACQHGNEVNGCEVVRRFAEKMARTLKRGRVLAVPFANPLALRHRRPHLDLGPEQPYLESRGHNMQTAWPGDPHGNDTERVAAALWEGVVTQATHVIDIHCYPRSAAPLVQYRSHHPENAVLALAMAFPFIRRVPAGDVGDWPGALGNRAGAAGKAAVGCELRGQYGVWEDEVRLGLRGLHNVAKILGMTPGATEGLDRPAVFASDPPAPMIVPAKQTGLFVPAKLVPGGYVGPEQTLGRIFSDESLRSHAVTSPAAGYLLRFGAHRANCDVSLKDCHPFVFEGDPLAVILPRPAPENADSLGHLLAQAGHSPY